MFKTYSCYLIIGQLGIRKSILFIVMITSLASMGLTSNQANGGNMVESLFDDNFVHISWSDFDFQPKGTQNPLTFEFDQNTALNLYTTGGFTSSMACTENFLCTFELANFVDELQTKIIFIDITFDTGTGSQPSPTPTVTCFDVEGTAAGPSPGILLEQGFDSPDLFIYDFKCMPNPDWEEITIQLDPNVILVEIWTTSFDDKLVGGTLIPIDKTSLLLAGAQMTAVWLIPVLVSAVGIGIVIARKM